MQAGNHTVFYDLAIKSSNITFYMLNLSQTCPDLRRAATDLHFSMEELSKNMQLHFKVATFPMAFIFKF